MKFLETKLKGVFIIDLDLMEDSRGFFARSFCAREFEKMGLSSQMVQANLCLNRKAGTVRGMHYQSSPADCAKLIRCVSGAVWDVVVDLRPGSPTLHEHVGVELSAENRKSIYIPPMFAHGYQSLVDDSELLYRVDEYYTPECEYGVRHDDPAFGISWPRPVSEISEKDRLWPLIETAPAFSGCMEKDRPRHQSRGQLNVRSPQPPPDQPCSSGSSKERPAGPWRNSKLRRRRSP